MSEILIAGGKSDGVSVRDVRRVMGRRKSGAVIVEVVSLMVVRAVSCLAAVVQLLLLQIL